MTEVFLQWLEVFPHCLRKTV